MPKVSPRSGGIGDTTAWKLINGLCESRNRFSYHGEPDAIGVSSSRTLELRNALRDLNLHIRTTFTILRFEALLDLESELEDDASQSSSESESDNESPPL